MEKLEQVPFLDLITQHLELENELLRVASACLRDASFVGGSLVTEFENSFASFCEARFCSGVNSGTDALRLALLAAAIGPGDVVVTVPNTFIATAEAITQTGAVPEFVDVDERTYNMDPEKLREYLETGCVRDAATGQIRSRRTGRRVAAIIPVHLYGQMADMDPILELAGRYDLVVLEDACQAHGARYFSRNQNVWFRAGSMGRAAAFSFYPGKNLGACGEAGAVTTGDKELANLVSKLRDHGQAQKYLHDCEGYNARLDAIQAGFLSVKLPHLEQWNARRRDLARTYCELFASVGLERVLPYEPSWSHATYHLFVIRTPDRNHLRDALRDRGIGTGIHYPIPVHLQKAYHHLQYQSGDFPVTEKVCTELLSLPMYPTLRRDQQEFVVSAVRELMPADCGRQSSRKTPALSETPTIALINAEMNSKTQLDVAVGS
jgi:dTDP-4-amino-4,6-dideoxygalactose transaminase